MCIGIAHFTHHHTHHKMGFWMLLACTVALLVFSISILYRSMQRQKPIPSNSGLKLPPGPVGHPLIGSLLYLIGPLRHNPHRSLVALAEAYGPIVFLRLGLTRAMVVVSSPSIAHEALAKNDAALADRLVPDNVCALSYGSMSMLFLPSSDKLWRQLRGLIGAGFSSSQGLEVIRPILEYHAHQLAVYLRACSGRPINIREVVSGTVLNIISNILFSEDVVDLHEQKQTTQTFKSLIVPVFQELSKPSVSDAFPFLAPLEHLLGSRRRISMLLAKLFKFFDEVIIEKRLAAAPGENHNIDILDILLSRLAMSKLTRQQITTFLTDAFIVATDSSTVTVQWAMARLLCHPDKMKKVKAELAEELGSRQFVTESDLSKLPYLHAVVKETLRLHPAVPLIPREVIADDVSLGGFHVPKGTGVIVNLWAIGRDKSVWPRPQEFIPERFLAGQEVHSSIVKEAYRPFGAGRRVCPGIEYTARSVPLLLASILHRNEWRLPDGDGIILEGIDLKDRYATVLNPAIPLQAVLVSSTM